MEPRGEILALTSSKGGVGKTHLAVSLSAAMAKRHARVLLIDTDLGNGIISDRLGFYPRYNLADFFSREKPLEDLIEQTPYGFFLVGGDRGNFLMANLNYLQKMRFLKNFIRISKGFDFVVLDLASGISRQMVDFALLADRTVVVACSNDLVSAYGSVRACFSRFKQLESRLSKRIKGYRTRRFFRPLILVNQVSDFHEGKAAFEALETAVESRLGRDGSPFRVRIDYLGTVFHDPGVFKKSEERRCPVSTASIYSKVAFCIDSMARTICDPGSFQGFDGDKRLQYTFQILMEQKDRVRKELARRVMSLYPVKARIRHPQQSVSP
ncbi:MAG: AAA family ATPase [Deltaproteobacteria bacterium]|nr:AAA family ATPase [Deltaproteobacteria bacterium]MBW2122902.1 AAA family ATPase [Deltaproteobacteria bacterium]